ncbi:hypothetical protein PS928_04320 [Pseudomonas fluorescens]|uniref:proton-translocating NAD(P)(+) transhydrogenase n=1 Tax=Pseudomonas fluorescens TaxID=294 RepID=A0A5E7UZ51_PSEFL|nr:hypothetical protein PS928_04320 [Pseudomonas fluorescens]
MAQTDNQAGQLSSANRSVGRAGDGLAKAEEPYDQVFEMEDINSEFGQADVVLVLGPNDVVNPAAKNDPKSPIAGMPILVAYKAKTVIVNKRSMASGYAGLDNELFYIDKTMAVFGDAKKVIEDMVKADRLTFLQGRNAAGQTSLSARSNTLPSCSLAHRRARLCGLRIRSNASATMYASPRSARASTSCRDC